MTPHLRPTCDKLLLFPAMLKKTEEINIINTDEEPQTLLSTIKFPKNFHYLTSMLPKPNYSPRKITIKDEKKDDSRKRHIKSLHS